MKLLFPIEVALVTFFCSCMAVPADVPATDGSASPDVDLTQIFPAEGESSVSSIPNLISLDITNQRNNTGNSMKLDDIFQGCENLSIIEISENFIIKKDTCTDKMFDNCIKLDLSIIHRILNI